MLVDFTVENYRSIKEPVTLSAVAQRSRSSAPAGDGEERRVKPDNEIAPPYVVPGWDLELLPVLAIFGANASGKSNVVRALDDVLAYITLGSGNGEVFWAKFMPFLFERTYQSAPTLFEIRVAANNIVYTYCLHLSRQQIIKEHLAYSPALAKRERLLYSRCWNSETQVYDWANGSSFAGAHTQLESRLTILEPFLSLLTRLNVPVMQPLTDWLRFRSLGISLGYEELDEAAAVHHSATVPDHFSKLSALVRLFDTGITKLEIVNSETKNAEMKTAKIVAWHSSDGGEVPFPLQWESIGTQRLIGLASRIGQTQDCSTVLLIDELGSNIHPNITREIVRMFQSPTLNPNRAQLIFTSHDNTLQRGQLLRRDQIWFTQKRADGSTELYSLSDFKPRNDLAIDRAYLDGRFGAVPILPDEEELARVLTGLPDAA